MFSDKTDYGFDSSFYSEDKKGLRLSGAAIEMLIEELSMREAIANAFKDKAAQEASNSHSV